VKIGMRHASKATASLPLRPNRVHPLWRTDHNNDVGINAPEIEYAFHPDAVVTLKCRSRQYGEEWTNVEQRLPRRVDVMPSRRVDVMPLWRR
jgi:hypothetical protein